MTEIDQEDMDLIQQKCSEEVTPSKRMIEVRKKSEKMFIIDEIEEYPKEGISADIQIKLTCISCKNKIPITQTLMGHKTFCRCCYFKRLTPYPL